MEASAVAVDSAAEPVGWFRWSMDNKTRCRVALWRRRHRHWPPNEMLMYRADVVGSGGGGGGGWSL